MMTPEEYEAKRTARYERLRAAADRLQGQANATTAQAREMADVIPFGQPILVNHHSEKGDRRYRARIDSKFRKGYDLHKKAEALRERASAMAHNRAIFSDDPAAESKIEDRIALLESRQALMKKANALVRAGDRAGLSELGFTDGQIGRLFDPDFMGRKGFPGFALTNNSANIRRLKDRLRDLQARAQQESTEQEIALPPIKEIGQVAGVFATITIRRNVEANRLQIIFPGKPDQAIRADLKSAGFRWAPSEGAWQRHLSNQAEWQAQAIIDKHYGKESSNA